MIEVNTINYDCVKRVKNNADKETLQYINALENVIESNDTIIKKALCKIRTLSKGAGL